MKTLRKVLLIVSLLIVGCVAIVAAALMWDSRDMTTYASGYREERFAQVRVGMPGDQVVQLLGEPLLKQPTRPYEMWEYGKEVDPNGKRDHFSGVRFDLFDDYGLVEFDPTGVVRWARGPLVPKVHAGMSRDQVRSLYGEPPRSYSGSATEQWYYTTAGKHGKYEARIVSVDGSQHVSRVDSYSVYD